MGSKYQAYPEYKDSGVEWIGSIPNNWSVSKLGYLINTIVPMRDKPTSLEGEIPWIRIEDFDGKYIFSSKSGQGVTESTINEFNLKVFPVGTVLCTCSCSMGTTAIVASPLISNQTFIGLLPGEKLDSEYLYYLMQASEAELTSKSAGAIQKYLSQDEFKALRFGFPSLNEQRIIANFLDHETAKIDTLIEKQQQLIKLLKEKRQAVISHAVTKGLNPNAKMRDSGVEWLGEVPEHWEVSRIKNVVSEIVDGPHFSPKYEDEGYMFISARNIKVDRWSLEDAKYISEADFHEFNKRVRPGKGDVLLTKGGTTGVARAVDLDFPFQVWVHVAVLKTNQTLMDPFYLAYVLNGTACYEQSQQYTFGATNNDLGLSRIAKIIFARPSMAEQHKLRMWLDDECKKFDCLISKGLESIQLIQERRTALISAAVTGKIDVRDWQAPNV